MAKEKWFPICTRYQNCALNEWKSSNVYFIKPIYEISTAGRIRNANTKQILSVRPKGKGNNINGEVTLSTETKRYYWHEYCTDGRMKFSVARIFYQTFYGPLGSHERVKFDFGLRTLKY